MNIHFYIPLAYDRIPNPQSLEGQGSKARCRAIIEKTIQQLKQHSVHGRFWILTAGYSKENPAGKWEKSLAWQMYSYIIYYLGEEHPLLDEMYTLMSARVWGTMGEVGEAIRLTQEQLDSYKADCKNITTITVFFSTHWVHMPRVWLCWYYLAPRGWRIRYVYCHHHFGGFTEYLKEFGKLFRYWQELRKMKKQKPG